MDPRGTCVLLVPAMLLAWCQPLSAHARTQPEGEVSPSAEPAHEDDPALDEAQRLFSEGALMFETADYAGAIERWTAAYGLVPSVPEYSVIKAKLIANLSAAHERAYAVDERVEHLNQAKILLESYRASIDTIYTEEEADERDRELAWVVERLTKIDAELQAVAEREAAARQTDPEPRSESESSRAPGRGLVIGGGVLTGLGVAGLGVMAGGMVLGSQNNDVTDLPTNDLDARGARFAQGRLGNALAIAGGVGGGLLLAAGVGLLVVGLNKNRAAATPGVALVPSFDRTQAGLALVGRF
ncbi:hypothetical protein [Enhygromyxa salina]|uniref:Tetratricopeptide repeat protein n=1 Tax=Enhygromyxa salina TaxID=215803 RepID=A0A2S9XN86_9BACT|nr:hypothetical protein [Enhygromyxa salina]PRP94334.1 hypothetical protein ENSA7_78710 [Enhygromyxa salina]